MQAPMGCPVCLLPSRQPQRRDVRCQHSPLSFTAEKPLKPTRRKKEGGTQAGCRLSLRPWPPDARPKDVSVALHAAGDGLRRSDAENRCRQMAACSPPAGAGQPAAPAGQERGRRFWLDSRPSAFCHALPRPATRPRRQRRPPDGGSEPRAPRQRGLRRSPSFSRRRRTRRP